MLANNIPKLFSSNLGFQAEIISSNFVWYSNMATKIYQYISYRLEQGVGIITLNRPDQHNALQYPMIMEIIDVFESVFKKKAIRAVVIQGDGPSFSAGDDLKSMGKEGFRFKPLKDGSVLPHHRLIRLIREIQKPVIAFLHGYCLGAGFALALACDFRLASDNLEMGDHRVTRAICMMSGASWLLPRLIGLAKATDLILTGRHLNAQEAVEMGLITQVFPAAEFQAQAMAYAHNIASLPTRTLGYNKTMLNYSLGNELAPSMTHEFDLTVRNMGTQDYTEGIKSFREKRKPNFQGK